MVLFPLCFGTAGTILRVQTDSVVKYGFPIGRAIMRNSAVGLLCYVSDHTLSTQCLAIR
jgi:hypothetical protein